MLKQSVLAINIDKRARRFAQVSELDEGSYLVIEKRVVWYAACFLHIH